jgi:hypothetical protein
MDPYKVTFESRLIPQSRECYDQNGNVFYEHNEYLHIGETVVLANTDIEVTVANSRYRNPLNCQELVTVLVPRKDGSVDRVEMPASSVRRLKLAER